MSFYNEKTKLDALRAELQKKLDLYARPKKVENLTKQDFQLSARIFEAAKKGYLKPKEDSRFIQETLDRVSEVSYFGYLILRFAKHEKLECSL